ncbi:MAG: PepSY domain-containing protein [Ruegeria sp.]|uniref:PepSY domain-containing protein n=1 Tax=Ruegeria sp. TaxID=1879320 RepID=UPI00349EC0CA
MNTFKTLTLTSAIIAVPALAFAGFAVGDKLGTDEATIRAKLEEQGYIVQEIEVEGDEIEVEVLKDGVETELELSLADGTVTEIETEED